MFVVNALLVTVPSTALYFWGEGLVKKNKAAQQALINHEAQTNARSAAISGGQTENEVDTRILAARCVAEEAVRVLNRAIARNPGKTLARLLKIAPLAEPS